MLRGKAMEGSMRGSMEDVMRRRNERRRGGEERRR